MGIIGITEIVGLIPTCISSDIFSRSPFTFCQESIIILKFNFMLPAIFCLSKLSILS